jgi:phenylacetate-CoA ligase
MPTSRPCLAKRCRAAAAAPASETLRNAWDHVPWQPAAAAGRRPGRVRATGLEPGRAAPPAVHGQDRPARQLPLRPVHRPVGELARLHASSGTTGKPTVVGYTAQDLSTPGPTWWRARSTVPARARATWCTTPTATACSPAAWARTTAPRGWAPGGAHLRRLHRAPGGADHGLQAPRAVRHAVVCAGHRRGGRAAGRGPAQDSALRVGMFGAEPWSEAMRREIEARMGLRRSTSTACPRSWARAWPASARQRCGLHGWEDHFLFEVVDPDTGSRCPRARPANW